jgi:hypothetical protein
MTRRYLIRKHPAVITATEIQIIGSQGVYDPVLRFKTLRELIEYFFLLGAPTESLEAVRPNFDATGMASLIFYQKG